MCVTPALAHSFVLVIITAQDEIVFSVFITMNGSWILCAEVKVFRISGIVGIVVVMEARSRSDDGFVFGGDLVMAS